MNTKKGSATVDINGTAYNFDFEADMARPAAWRKMKEGFGRQYSLDRLLRRIEKLADGRTARSLLAIAIHSYISMTTEQRAAAAANYYRWSSMLEGRGPGRTASPPRDTPAMERISSAEADGLLDESPMYQPGDPYAIHVSPDVIVDKDGEPCDSQVDHVDHVIWLASGLSESRRQRALRAAQHRAQKEISTFGFLTIIDMGKWKYTVKYAPADTIENLAFVDHHKLVVWIDPKITKRGLAGLLEEVRQTIREEIVDGSAFSLGDEDRGQGDDEEGDEWKLGIAA